MAWITVDQKLIGGKLRDFAKRSGISQNEAVGVLIRLWLWGLDNADENGRIIAADHEDIEEAIRPGFLETDRGAISKIVTNLVECGWIDREKGCLYLHDWIDWRSFYNSYEEKKAKNAERMRNYRASRAKTAEPAENEPTESNPEKMEEPEEKPAAIPEKPGLYCYTPEMGEQKPKCQIEAERSYYGRHYHISTPLELKGRGITFDRILESKNLSKSAQYRLGWREYTVTERAFEKLQEQYTISQELLLD